MQKLDPYLNLESKVGAVRYARERGIPTLRLCLGLQCMTIEVARHLAGLEGANSLEFDPGTAHPVIATVADQRDIVAGKGELGGTMRLGSYPATLTPGSLVAQAYGSESVTERHRHRYEVNNAYRDGSPGPAWSSPALRRTAGWSSSSSWTGRCTLTSWPLGRTRR
jgi:CTP synthase